MNKKIKRPITHYPLPFTSKAGFTLVELAMVLVVIGLLIGLGMGLIGPLTKRAKYTETKETINAGVESIVGYVASNGRVPIWGDYTADATIDEFIEVVKDPNDAWTKPLYYFFESLLTSNDSVCNRKTTNLTICRDATCSNRIQNIAFIAVSSSENYNPQTGIVTTGCPTGQTCVGVYDVGTPNIDNCTNATNCPNYPAGVDRISRQESYDDIVKWVTLDELRIKAGCVGPQLKILNNELPSGKLGSAYNATVYADGGVPFSSGGDYKWCIKGTLPTGMTNPTPGCPATTDCSTLGGEGATEWLQASSLSITGTPSSSGSFNITVFVRDNNDNDVTRANDNCAQKSFVITISP